MEKASKLDRLLSIVLTSATLIVAAILVEGRINPPKAVRAGPSVSYVKEWRSIRTSAGTSLGDTTRPISIAIFTDFECPFCGRLDSTLSKLESDNPGKIVRTVIHLPIPAHEHAKAAAEAFECAAVQGQAYDMHRVLYAHQRGFATSTWTLLASEAGVRDAAAFRNCMARSSGAIRIAAGVATASKLSVSATPTVMINGWMFMPSEPEPISVAVNAVLHGKSPKP